MNTQQQTVDELIGKGFDLVDGGRLEEAKAQFEQACVLDSTNAEAWMMSGSVNAELGNSDAAFNALQTALKLDSSLPETHYYLAVLFRTRNDINKALEHASAAMTLDAEYGEAFLLGAGLYGLLGRMDEGEQCCRKALALLPQSPDVHMNLGNFLMQRGAVSEACQQFNNAAGLQPNAVDPWIMLGRAYARLGDMQQSSKAYQRVLQLKPDAEEAFYGLGFAAYRSGQYQEAVGFFQSALAINPAYADAANSLATAHQAQGHYEEALVAYNQALAIKPDHVEALVGKSGVLIDLSRQQEAMACLQQALQIRPDYADAYLNMSSVLMTFGKPDEALSCCEKALQLQPGNVDAVALAAKIEQHAGQIEKAYARLKAFVSPEMRHVNIAIAYGEVCSSINKPEEAIDVQERFINDGDNLPVTSRRNLHFGLGKLYNKVGDYDKAFANYAKGNDLRGVDWDPQQNSVQVDAIIANFSKEFLAQAPRASIQSERPIFVLGMPRSGTTLVEQVLASHPAVFGAGELPDLMRMVHNLPAFLGTARHFPACVGDISQAHADKLAQYYLDILQQKSIDASRVVDKMPGNFSYLGLIEMLFPKAHVIHCVRDPLDTCLSCYFQDFARSQSYSYNLAHLGVFYKDYARMMAHWNDVLSIPVLDLKYEDLVSDQEAVSRKLIEFCGLEWDAACLNFHNTERFVSTASYDQVRRPIYKSSMKRWEKYLDQIGPLVDALK